MLRQEVHPKCSISGAGRYPFGSVLRVKTSSTDQVLESGDVERECTAQKE